MPVVAIRELVSSGDEQSSLTKTNVSLFDTTCLERTDYRGINFRRVRFAAIHNPFPEIGLHACTGVNAVNGVRDF